MKTITFLSVFLFSLFADQEKDSALIKDFLRTVSENKVTQQEIIDKYLFLTPSNDDLKEKQKIELIKYQLTALKDSLKGKDSLKFVFIPYKQASSSEQIINVDENLKKNVYIVKYTNAYFMSILIKEGRINSFTTMNKGQRRIFLLN